LKGVLAVFVRVSRLEIYDLGFGMKSHGCRA